MATTSAVRIPERYNASRILDDNLAAGRADKVAVIAGADRLTYGELLRTASRYGAALRELGAALGDRVLLALDDCTSFPAVFLGAMRAGLVPVPVNPLLGAEDYAYFASDSGAALIVVDSGRAEKVADGCPGARIVLVGGGVDGLDSLEDAAASQPDELPPVDTHRDDAAFWLYSSGSTGRPKGVVHLHHDILYTCETYGKHVLRIDEADVTFSTTKLFHAYGLGNNLSFPYSVGATTVLLSGRATPETVFETIRAARPTLFFSAPTLYNALLNAPGAADQDLSSIRLCVSAAEPLPAEVWQRWRQQYSLTILDGIGSTEMLHIYCSNTTEECVPGSSGRPVPGYDLKLVGDDGAEVEGEGVGDLYARGDSALDCYWNQPERTADCLRDGWFYTRDRYRRDAAGIYWYEGRADDMFKVSGLWVSPAEVEGRLIEHPAVVESAVVGVSVDGFVKPKAFVVLREPVAEQELEEFCAAKLHRYEVPRAFAFVDELPKTVTGKIQRFKLRG